MAILVDTRGRFAAPPSLCVLGRSSACVIRVDDARVSGTHAQLAWSGAHWILRDLGSRNGTFLNGRPVARDGVVLSASDRVSLGCDEVSFVIADVAPPSAHARVEPSGELRHACGGVLLLPSSEHPRAAVYRDERGAWLLEERGDLRAVSDGERVVIGDDAFTLCLPVAVEPTAEASDDASVHDARVLFRVSRDEERVEVVVTARASRWVLAPRSHFYTLLLMARARQRDEQSPALPEASRGWLSVDDLCVQLGSDENKVNVDMHRIRRDFGAIGLRDGGSIVERRRGTRQLRLGSTRVAIEKLSS